MALVTPNRTTSIAAAVAGSALLVKLFPAVATAALILGIVGGVVSYVYQLCDDETAAPVA